VGQGWFTGRASGGCGMISNWVTERAPCRIAVPRQSAPVSPPPMITTSLPVARIWFSTVWPRATRFAWGRYSIAWWMPANSRPSTVRSRATVDPIARTTASKRSRSSSPVMSAPMSTPGLKTVPSSRICLSLRSRTCFSILNSGIP